jgi:glycosyltransferase involved in cell wall biosynthesis
VVVDGGDDKTAEIARSYPGVIVIEFPVNLGHGVALQVTYRYCIEHHVQVRRHPRRRRPERPLGDPPGPRAVARRQADFVVASRRLGIDKTSDRSARLGVFFFSFIMNRMTGATSPTPRPATGRCA